MINDFNSYLEFSFSPKDNLMHNIIRYKCVKPFIKYVFIGSQLGLKKNQPTGHPVQSPSTVSKC